MNWTWYLIAVAVLVIIIRRRDLRKQMLVTVYFSVPLIFLQPLLTGNWSIHPVLIVTQIVTVASLAALAAALYQVLISKRLSSLVHPDRKHLAWLALSPLTMIALALLFHLPVIFGLLAALVIDVAVIIVLRRGLLWDVIISGAGFGVLYTALFMTATIIIPGEWSPIFLRQQTIGLTLYSVPIEEVLFVLLLGAIIGPLYASTKSVRSPSIEEVGIGDQRLKASLGIAILSLSMLATVWTLIYFVIPPKVTAAQPDSAVPVTYQPTVHFSRPISRERMIVTVQPQVEGQVVFDRPTFGGHAFRTARFVPTIPFDPEIKYIVTFSGIGSLAGVGDESVAIEYSTLAWPKVISIGGTEPVNPCGPIAAVLDRPTDQMADFSFTLEPDGQVAASLESDSQTYQLKPTACLRQGVSYTVKAWRQITLQSSDGLNTYTSDREVVATLPITTAAEPQLISVTPNGIGVPLATSQIVMTFADPMPAEAVLAKIMLEPTLAGQWSWTDDRTLAYNATEPLTLATTYRVTIPAGTSSVHGGIRMTDLVTTFTAIGPIPVPAVSPANGTNGYTVKGRIRLTFDQIVDEVVAEAAWSLNPPVPGELKWQGTTLEFVPKTILEPNTTYTVKLSSGLTGPYGLPSIESLTSTFSTEVSQSLLPIPLDFQDQPLSCEAAALKMALAGKGVKVTERQIMDLVGYDRTPHRGNIWGDPNKGFVGLITGRQNTTGYGVHWAPIAKAAKHWRPAKAFSDWTPAQLAAEITKGNPVVIWGVQGAAYPTPWRTPSGTTIKAWKGEHARTVIGYHGPALDPTAFIINDPIAGRITWSTATLKANWSTFNNSGVVVE